MNLNKFYKIVTAALKRPDDHEIFILDGNLYLHLEPQGYPNVKIPFDGQKCSTYTEHLTIPNRVFNLDTEKMQLLKSVRDKYGEIKLGPK